MADTARSSAHPGAILGIARFLHDPRGSMRAMLESNPGEARLLAYAVLAAMLLLVERLFRLFAEAAPGADLTPRVVEQVVSLMFFLPLAYYGLAAVATMIARALGGQGGWFQGRAAFFWAALVSAPIVVLTGLAALAAGPGAGAAILRQAASFFFAWALANCFAEAFGFTSTMRVLAVIVVIALVPLGLVWALAST